MPDRFPSATRRFLAVAATLLIVAATAWGAMRLTDPVDAARQRDLAAALQAAQGDPAILAAAYRRQRQPRATQGCATAGDVRDGAPDRGPHGPARPGRPDATSEAVIGQTSIVAV